MVCKSGHINHTTWPQTVHQVQYGEMRCNGKMQKLCIAVYWLRVYCNTLHWTTLNITVLHIFSLQCTVLDCTVLLYTALHCTALHCTALHCTAHRKCIPVLLQPYCHTCSFTTDLCSNAIFSCSILYGENIDLSFLTLCDFPHFFHLRGLCD